MGYPEQWNKRSGIPKREQGMEQPISMAEVALKYARMGFHVFPLAENGKIPLKASHGLLDATTDPLLIEAAWSSNANLNIGLRTGKESGIIVVDIDPRNNGNEHFDQLQRRYGRCASTLLVRTPRGGIHRYYQHPKDQEYGSPIGLDGLSGIDVRSEGAYVLLPPSTLFAGKAQYKWVKEDFPIAKTPDWLLKLIAKSSQVQTTEISVPYQIRREGNFEAKSDKWLLDAIGRATPGNRNRTLFEMLLQERDDGKSEAEATRDALFFASQVSTSEHPFSDREALATVKSVFRRPPRPPATRR